MKDGNVTGQELERQFSEAKFFFDLIQKLNNTELPPTKDDYLNLNRAYFRMCSDFYESFLDLIKNCKPFPAFVILRSFLEVYTKGIYLELIEKPKNTDIKPLINDEKDFPSFFKMTSELDNLGEEGNNGLAGMFMQFTKKGLGHYHKLSLFTHGRGEYVQALMKSSDVRSHINDVSDLILTARGMYETFSLFYFGLQKQPDAFRTLLEAIKTSSLYSSATHGKPA